ncbi:MAG: cytochrome c biogenesis CcdA family protein [Acetobacteraceae bacterium]
MGTGTILFGFAAGIFSTLSPCVLPLLPLVMGTAVSAHRYGAAALAGGMVLSFVSVGLFVATVGFSIGLDSNVFRLASAGLLVAIGSVLLSAALQQRVALLAGGLSNAGNLLIDRMTLTGLTGQFLVGVVLGAIWTPCVGPTLGAASVMASRGQDLGSVSLVMLAFGLGAALPLALVGSLSREALTRWRGRLLGAGQTGKTILGGGALAIGLLILTGADHTVEAWLVNASPAWLTDLTTSY